MHCTRRQIRRHEVTIADSILDLVGSTPMVPLRRIATRSDVRIVLKLEGFNPGRSVKDRPVMQMTRDAELKDLLRPGSTLIESTSGNTGVAMAMVGAVRGYEVVCVADQNLIPEKLKVIRLLGGQVVRVESESAQGSLDLTEHRIEAVQQLVTWITNAACLNQYSNPSNPVAHYLTTAREIFDDLEGNLDCVVVSVGTGGTVSGVGTCLKELIPAITVCGVEPLGSTMFGGVRGPYLQQGPGNYFRPDNLDLDCIDLKLKISDRDAFTMTRRLAREEGILVGGDSGGLVHIALDLAESKRTWKNVVVICPDAGEKYLNTVFSDAWLNSHGLA